MKENLKILLKCYDVNPLKTLQELKKHKLKYELSGNTDGVNFLKIVDFAINELEEKKQRRRISEITAIGGTIEGAKVIVLAHQMYTAGEISEDVAANMVVNAVTPEMIKHFETGLKFNDLELRNICESLKKEGYISSSKKFFNGIKGVKQIGEVWLKPKAMLIYLFEQISENGKCNYSEISENLNIEIKANHKKGGYNEIDKIINLATMY